MASPDKAQAQAEQRELFKRIRKRDKRQCTRCGATAGYDVQGRDIIKVILVIVHKDHDTTNFDENNLLTMCQACALWHADSKQAPGDTATKQLELL